MTKVSVISIYYNRAAWIEQSVRCLLAQDHDDLEIILVDDGSTDDTLAILSRFESARVRVLSHANIGFVAALTEAIARSKGEYIALHGSGDLCAPSRLSRQAEILDRWSAIGLVACGTERISPADGRRIDTHVLDINGDAAALVARRNPFHHGELMYRRACYDAIGGYRPFFRYAQDHDLVCRMSRVTQFHFIKDILYSRYVRLPGSVSAAPEKVLLQECLSDFAIHCHEEVRRGRPDPLDAHGPAAALIVPPRPRLARRLRALGLWRLRQRDFEAARIFLAAARAKRPDILSSSALALARLQPSRNHPPRPREPLMEPREEVRA